MGKPQAAPATVPDSHNRVPTSELRIETVSTVEAAANALRELILDGQLEPGTWLREAEFAERLGIARHSFRAATQILITEGMLRREPHRGVQVTVLTAADILDTFRLRAALEVEAVRLAIAAGRIPDEARQAVEDLSAVPDGAPWRDVVDPDMRFHCAFIDAAESPRIARAYASVQSEIELCMVQLRAHYERPSQVAAEHTDLLAAIEAGDPDLATERFRQHLTEAVQNLSNALASGEGENAEEVTL
jgi:DNA-binding GntR family transcriptional regulator